MTDPVNPRFLRPLDWLLLTALVASGAWLTCDLFSSPAGERAMVWIDGRRAAWFPLGGPTATDTVQGALGPVVLEHGEGSVRVLRAPCPGHLCMRQGVVHRSGEKLVCVPSRVVVTIEGGTSAMEGIDAAH